MVIQNKPFKATIVFWGIAFGFIGLVIFQNRTFFMAEWHLVLNLGFHKYETPPLANAVFFVAFFILGILLTYFLSLFKHFKDAKTIKRLKAKESSLVETITTLESRLLQHQNQNEAKAAALSPDDAQPGNDPGVDVHAEVK